LSGRVAQRAANNLLHLAFMQVNARTKHSVRLKFQVPSSKFQTCASDGGFLNLW
jgi:hypothetical protein